MTVRGNRRKTMRMRVIALDKGKCQAFWMPLSSNWMENILEVAHLISKRPYAEHLDEDWNGILLKRYVHEMIDGRRRAPNGLTARDFTVALLLRLKNERPAHFEKRGWRRALDEIKKKVKENDS